MTFVPAHRRFDSQDSVSEIKKQSSLSGIRDKIEKQKQEKTDEHIETSDDEN